MDYSLFLLRFPALILTVSLLSGLLTSKKENEVECARSQGENLSRLL